MGTSAPSGMAVVCIPAVFSSQERTQHQAVLTATVLGRAVERRELADGIELAYAVDADVLSVLTTWMLEERRCCPFLTFELRLEAGDHRMRLSMRGPDGTLDVLRAAFHLA